MKITNAHYAESGNGLPLLKLTLRLAHPRELPGAGDVALDGIEATIDPQQKFLDRDTVILGLPPGPAQDALPPVSLPAIPARGIGPLTLRSATQDKEVLRLVRAFVKAVESGQFQVGPVK